MGWGKACLKSSSLLFAAIFFLISMAEILCGTFMYICMSAINRPETVGEQYITLPSLTLILFGISLLPLIILGCCGFCKEVACCVNVYSSVLLVLSVLQIVVGAFAIFIFTKDNNVLSDQIKEDFIYSFKNYQKDVFLNITQKEMHCCGVTSPLDWKHGLPSSCCGDKEAACHLNSDFLFEKGCADVLTMFVVVWNTIIGYASIATGCLQILVAVLGFSLGCGSFRYYYKV